MESLPDVALEIIFSKLPVLTLLDVVVFVCRRWAMLVQRLALACNGNDRLERVSSALLAMHCNLRYPNDLEVLVDRLVEGAPRLQHLTVHSDTPLQLRHITELSKLRHLRHLDVFMVTKKIDTTMLPLLLPLDSLVLNENVSSRVLRALADHGRLTALHMYGRSTSQYSRSAMAALIHNCDLRELTLRCQKLPDDVYELIGNCENLTSLQLYTCRLLTEKGAAHLTRPRRLKRLHVTGANMLPAAALAAMLKRLPPCLEELVLSATNFRDEHMDLLAQHARRLRVLELCACRVTADAITTLAISLPDLETLELNIALSIDQLSLLAAHPSLRLVRCAAAPSCGEPDMFMVEGLRVVPAFVRYCNSFKFDPLIQEGFRASFYFYWMQYTNLKPSPFRRTLEQLGLVLQAHEPVINYRLSLDNEDIIYASTSIIRGMQQRRIRYFLMEYMSCFRRGRRHPLSGSGNFGACNRAPLASGRCFRGLLR